MTQFAMWLNELTPPGLEKKLAPTDCRLRPDQHFLEEGVYDQVLLPCSCALPCFMQPCPTPALPYPALSSLALPCSCHA